jgi:hypothetical protein
MIAIAFAGIYSFALEPLKHRLLNDFLDKLYRLSNEVANLVANICIIKIICSQ